MKRHFKVAGRRALCVRACVLGLIAIAAAPCGIAMAQPPGPESFAKEPKTPTELWDAIDYLVRVGQIDKAAPYLAAFVKTNPDDAMLVALRDKYGVGSFLRLTDDAKTREVGEKLFTQMTAAAVREATKPERIERFASALTATTEERTYAIEQLRSAGPRAVPAIAARLLTPQLDAQSKAKLTASLGGLDKTAVPAIIGLLAAPDAGVAAAAAQALGAIGDRRALADLTIPAALPDVDPSVQTAARVAIARITGKPYSAQPRAAGRLLADMAWAYERNKIPFPSENVELWIWDAQGGLHPVAMPASDAEEALGLKFADAALRIDPNDRGARVARLSLALDKEIARTGLVKFPGKDANGLYAEALAAGPGVLGAVLENAIRDGKSELGAIAATLLGQVAKPTSAGGEGGMAPLIAGLSAPDSRIAFASARAIALLNPTAPFAGSSRVVPVLARRLIAQKTPKAVIIDSSIDRANLLASSVRKLGYDTVAAETGPAGFQAAVKSSDVELVFIEPSLVDQSWRLSDLIANLRGDARSARLPIFLYGGAKLEPKFRSFTDADPRIAYLITPLDEQGLKRQIDRKPPAMTAKPLSAEEREIQAKEAAALLAQIAGRSGGPFTAGLADIEPALAAAVFSPDLNVAGPSAFTLGEVPGAPAQRTLADILLDPSRPLQLRLTAADRLSRSIQRFGALVSASQEAKLDEEFKAADTGDPNLRAALSAVKGSLVPEPERSAPAPSDDPAGAGKPAPAGAPAAKPASDNK